MTKETTSRARYARVKVRGRRASFFLRLFTETEAALTGTVVDRYGDELRVRTPFAVHVETVEEWEDGSTARTTTTVIPRNLIERAVEAEFNLKYGWLEEV